MSHGKGVTWETSERGRGDQIPEWQHTAVIFNPCAIAGETALSRLLE